MKFNLTKTLVALVGLLCTIGVYAHDFEVSGIYYKISPENNDEVYVTYYGDNQYGIPSEYKYKGVITIPKKVLYQGTPYYVTEIGDYAFGYCFSLTEITISNSVTTIGDYAFDYCYSLTEITIPNSVTEIGNYAFESCSSLTEITIPNSVTEIGAVAFCGCSSLTEITIPNSVTTIGVRTFEDCSNLKEIAIPNSVTEIGISAFRNCSSLTEITIPNSVTEIGEEAFKSCSSLTEITIPNSVTEIGEGVFESCSSLTEITIPNSVTTIGDYTFRFCSSLTEITIPNSVTEIGEGTFDGCSSLTEIVVELGNRVYDSRENCNAIIETATNTIIRGCCNTIIPNSVTTIGRSAFGSSSLTEITIPNSVSEIGDYAFAYCSSLTEITIPNSVTEIGEGTFCDCSSLTEITIPNSVTTIDAFTFYYCSSLTEITIPNSVTEIGHYAFCDCSSLTEITIPNSVTEIGIGAFSDCSFTEIIIDAITPPNIYEDAFSDYDATLIVPKGCVDVYKNHDVWGNFSEIVERENNDDNGDDNEDDNGDDDNSEDIEIEDIEITDVNRNWGMLRNDVIENQPYEYEMLDEDETSVIFTKSVDKSTAVFVSYKFDTDDCLCAATLSLPESVKAKEWLDEIFSEFKADIYVEDNVEVKKIDDNIITYDRSNYMDAGNFITVGFSYYEPMEERDDCVDLGLSVRWATMNLGAKSPEGVGNFYAFSETSTKLEYWRENYTYCNNNSDKYIFEYNNPLANICGTQYDAATKKLGDGWKMPSVYEANELLTLCTWTKETVNGMEVYRVTGPNGNSIIIPIVGRKRQDDDYKTRLELAIGESPSKTSEYCYSITPIAGILKVDTMFKAWGLNIRPVYTK